MLDDVLKEIADRAGSASRQPDFAELVRRGRARRRRQAVAAGTSVLVVVGAVAAGAATLGAVDQSAPPPAGHTHAPPTPISPTHSPSPSPARQQQPLATAEQIVQAPNARLETLAVSPDGPSTKAAVWSACRKAGRSACARPKMALAVTSDDFAHAHYVSLPSGEDVHPTLTALNHGSFFVDKQTLGPPGRILSADGDVRQVRDRGVAPSPLGPGEQLVACPPSRKTEPCVLGLDVSTAIAHPVPTSDLGPQTIEQTDGVGLWSVGVGPDPTHSKPVVSWSRDGRHWSQHDLTGAPGLRGIDTVQPMPSAADRTMAVAAGSIEDVFIVHSFHRSIDAGATWQSFTLDAHGALPVVDWSVVPPDGTLVIDTEDWIGPHGKEHAKPAGIYASNGTDWSRFSRVTVSLPSGIDPASYWGNQLLDARMNGAGHQSLYVTGYTTGAPVLVSTDGGRTWLQTPAR